MVSVKCIGIIIVSKKDHSETLNNYYKPINFKIFLNSVYDL